MSASQGRCRRTYAYLSSPQGLRRVHGTATLIWLVLAPVSMLTGLRHSVPYLVGLSVYAVVAGHWSSWQAARVEVRQDEGE